jgi:hypothetical protein
MSHLQLGLQVSLIFSLMYIGKWYLCILVSHVRILKLANPKGANNVHLQGNILVCDLPDCHCVWFL